MGYVPMDAALFKHILEQCPGRTFLDVGCGEGDKLQIATELGFEATGLELREEYASAARQVCPRVIVGNALDFTGYGNYDVIYTYQIMARDQDLRALEIESCAR